MDRRCNSRWRKAREAYISMLLIAMAAQAVWAFTPCVAVRLPPAKLRDPVWFARLIYAEAMAVMPFMFVVSAPVHFVSRNTNTSTPLLEVKMACKASAMSLFMAFWGIVTL